MAHLSFCHGKWRKGNKHWKLVMEVKNKIIEEIRKIYDPELPVNIYELGLIYDIKVEDISFEGSWCAISMASASIMTDLIKGKSDNEAKEIIEDFLGMIKENPELKNNILKEDDKTKLMCLSGVKQYPMRVKCATLSWHTLVSAMENDGKEITTEK